MPDTFISILLFFGAAAIVLFLPGAAWLAWDRSDQRDPLEWAAEAAGLSIAITAALAAIFFWVGFQISGAGLVMLYLLALAAWLGPRLLGRQLWQISAAGLGAAAVVLALTAFRIFQARALALPAWVDSVQHTLLVRIILEHGGLPPDWMPYLPAPLYYHFGFHVLAASFVFWSQLELTQAVLVFGQVINAVVAISVYRLGKVLWGDWRRAGLAALLVGFAFHMPAYYLTWGRYTLLAGMALLPLAIASALEIRKGQRNKAALARLVLYTAGICFTHYLVTALLALFFICLAAAEGLRLIKTRRLAEIRWHPFAACAVGVLVSSPWLLRVWQYTQDSASIDLANPLDPSQAQGIRDTLNYILYLIGPTRNYVLLGLAGVGVILALIRRRPNPGIRETAVWALLLAFLSTPYAPRFNPFRPDLVAIVLFLPAALFLAGLLDTVREWLGRIRWRFAGQAALAFFVLASSGLLGWGIVQTGDILNPVTVFTTQADLTALRWINQNTPLSARFFINSTPWQGSFYRGVDGGYWIMPATGRFDLVVPIAIGWGSGQDITRYEGWAERASRITTCDDAFWSLVQETNLDYVYVRAGAGSLTPEKLDICQGLKRVYEQDGVSIYIINKNGP